MERLLGDLLGVLSAAALALPGTAHANFLEGYLAECSAVTSTSCTEVTGSSYGRQPIAFADARAAPALSSTAVAVPRLRQRHRGRLAGHAVYDAPSGGNLLLVIPLASTFSPPPDQGDVGALSITVTNLAIAVPATYSGTYAAGGTVGTTPDGSTVTAGIAAAITRGSFAARAPATDLSYVVQTPTTGFTITPANATSTLVLTPAGTLATGTLTMPAAPATARCSAWFAARP